MGCLGFGVKALNPNRANRSIEQYVQGPELRVSSSLAPTRRGLSIAQRQHPRLHGGLHFEKLDNPEALSEDEGVGDKRFRVVCLHVLLWAVEGRRVKEKGCLQV